MGKLMVYGTTSSAGKSLITTGLCRIFSNKGYKVAPFKSQNMSSKYYKLSDGKVIATAQVLQAMAAKCQLDIRMNPLILVPRETDGSDIYFMGDKIAYMKAREFFDYKKQLKTKVKTVFDSLKSDYDLVIIEGAGSPAEINLMEDDFVNTGMAELADCDCVLVVDINRGGAFAHLYGTVMILDEKDRKRIKGFVINKFRGDKSLLDSGIKMIEEMTDIPVLGVIDYKNYNLPDEDSMVEGDHPIKLEEISDSQLEEELDRLAKDIEEALDMDKLMELMDL